MSVILFNVTEVYQELATAYEGLKHSLHQTSEDRERFYRALRRMYYANVATYLCQYHDDTPLDGDELTAIDTVQNIPTRVAPHSNAECAQLYLRAWGSLKYNTMTNDGEVYKAEDSYELLQSLNEAIARLAFDAL